MGHSIVSPSASGRWLVCTPSAILESKEPKTKSVYADEGSLAHSLCEAKLRLHFGVIDKEEFQKRHAEIQKSELYASEMELHSDDYVNYVIERYNNYGTDSKVHVEVKVPLSYIPPDKGTIDCIIGNKSKGLMHVIDFKYGAGVKVEAKENSQMMIYALAMFHGIPEEDADLVDKVFLTIHQPRINNIDTWDTSIEYLLDWETEILKPQAAKAIKGIGEQIAGKHCRFCAVKAKCKALADTAVLAAQYDFKEVELLNNEQLTEMLTLEPVISDYLSALKTYCLQEALKGIKFDGFKLVAGRSIRKWSDEIRIKQMLNAEDYEREEYVDEKLKGITEIEKLVGKKQFNEILGMYVVKSEPNPTLAPLTDKRPEWGAVSEFND